MCGTQATNLSGRHSAMSSSAGASSQYSHTRHRAPTAPNPAQPRDTMAGPMGRISTGATTHRSTQNTPWNTACTVAGFTGLRSVSVSHEARRKPGLSIASRARASSAYTTTTTIAATTSGARLRNAARNAAPTRRPAKNANPAPYSQHAPQPTTAATARLHSNAPARDSPNPNQ